MSLELRENFKYFAFAALAASALSLLGLLLAHTADLRILENARPASIIHVGALWFGAGFLLWLVSYTLSPIISVAAGIAVAGANFNLLYRILIGPVPDYIPLPANYYGNVPDLAIFIGSFLLSLFMFYCLGWIIQDLMRGIVRLITKRRLYQE